MQNLIALNIRTKDFKMNDFTKFKIGDVLYYPLKDGIIKGKVNKISINKDGCWYQLDNGRSNYEKYFFKSFEEARQFCLDDELKKYQEMVKNIREWHE